MLRTIPPLRLENLKIRNFVPLVNTATYYRLSEDSLSNLRAKMTGKDLDVWTANRTLTWTRTRTRGFRTFSAIVVKVLILGAATCSDYIENVLPSVEAILVEILDLHQCRVYYYITK